MAIASSGSGTASLWAIAVDPYIGGGTWGWLYGYTLNVSSGALTYWWDSSSGLNNCNQSSKADGWLATAFTEPTLANGAAYVPSTSSRETSSSERFCSPSQRKELLYVPVLIPDGGWGQTPLVSPICCKIGNPVRKGHDLGFWHFQTP
jgi:hypothetical protein